MATAHAEKVLKYLEDNGTVNSLKLAELWNEDHQKVVGTVKSLICLGDVCISFIDIIILYLLKQFKCHVISKILQMYYIFR